MLSLIFIMMTKIMYIIQTRQENISKFIHTFNNSRTIVFNTSGYLCIFTIYFNVKIYIIMLKTTKRLGNVNVMQKYLFIYSFFAHKTLMQLLLGNSPNTAIYHCVLYQENVCIYYDTVVLYILYYLCLYYHYTRKYYYISRVIYLFNIFKQIQYYTVICSIILLLENTYIDSTHLFNNNIYFR